MRLLAAILFVWLADDLTSFQKKLDDINNEKVPRGARIVLTSAEINAFARNAARDIAPRAVHDLKLVLGSGNATGTARVDFLELNKARGGSSNWLMERMFAGERTVKVIAHMQTSEGRGRVDVDRVEVGDVAVDGPALQFLIDHYVVPEFPNAKVGQWFKLEHHVDHLEIKPEAVTVVIAK